MILLIDNYDSFVHNLARYFERLGQETLVVRNDAMDAAEVARWRPDAVVLSPGPCTPNEAGCSLEVVRRYAGELPMLGVCLGHQVIGAALGAHVVRGPEPVHGRSSYVRHAGEGIFAGLPDPLLVGRYHSLVVDEALLPSDLQVTARTEDGVVMALEHTRWPIVGVQFHPESILTEHGYEMLAAFLRRAGVFNSGSVPDIATERPAAEAAARLPPGPVTF